MLRAEEQEIIFHLIDGGVSTTEISRQLKRSMGAIYKYKKLYEQKTNTESPKVVMPDKIKPFHGVIEQYFKTGKRNVSSLYNDLKTQGYTSSYSLLNTKTKQIVEELDKNYKRSVRIETEPGEQAQVDWGSFGEIELNGRMERLYAFVYVLSFSRAMYVEFVVRQNQQTFQNCHINAFQALGIPKAIRYDNVKTVILSREKLADGSKRFHFNPAFRDFSLYYGFKPELCPPYWPRAKGKVEAGVKYLRYNFAQNSAFKKSIKTLEELNGKAAVWLDRVANERIHRTTQEKPIERWEKEKKFLQFSTNLPAYNTTPLFPRRSTKDGLVQYKANLYSVPTDLAQKKLHVREVAHHGLPSIEIYYQNKMVANHRLSLGRGQWIVNDEHLLREEKKERSPSDASVKRGKKKNWATITVTSRDLNYYNTLIPK